MADSHPVLRDEQPHEGHIRSYGSIHSGRTSSSSQGQTEHLLNDGHMPSQDYELAVSNRPASRSGLEELAYGTLSELGSHPLTWPIEETPLQATATGVAIAEGAVSEAAGQQRGTPISFLPVEGGQAVDDSLPRHQAPMSASLEVHAFLEPDSPTGSDRSRQSATLDSNALLEGSPVTAREHVDGAGVVKTQQDMQQTSSSAPDHALMLLRQHLEEDKQRAAAYNQQHHQQQSQSPEAVDPLVHLRQQLEEYKQREAQRRKTQESTQASVTQQKWEAWRRSRSTSPDPLGRTHSTVTVQPAASAQHAAHRYSDSTPMRSDRQYQAAASQPASPQGPALRDERSGSLEAVWHNIHQSRHAAQNSLTPQAAAPPVQPSWHSQHSGARMQAPRPVSRLASTVVLSEPPATLLYASPAASHVATTAILSSTGQAAVAARKRPLDPVLGRGSDQPGGVGLANGSRQNAKLPTRQLPAAQPPQPSPEQQPAAEAGSPQQQQQGVPRASGHPSGPGSAAAAASRVEHVAAARPGPAAGSASRTPKRDISPSLLRSHRSVSPRAASAPRGRQADSPSRIMMATMKPGEWDQMLRGASRTSPQRARPASSNAPRMGPVQRSHAGYGRVDGGGKQQAGTDFEGHVPLGPGRLSPERVVRQGSMLMSPERRDHSGYGKVDGDLKFTMRPGEFDRMLRGAPASGRRSRSVSPAAVEYAEYMRPTTSTILKSVHAAAHDVSFRSVSPNSKAMHSSTMSASAWRGALRGGSPSRRANSRPRSRGGMASSRDTSPKPHSEDARPHARQLDGYEELYIGSQQRPQAGPRAWGRSPERARSRSAMGHWDQDDPSDHDPILDRPPWRPTSPCARPQSALAIPSERASHDGKFGGAGVFVTASARQQPGSAPANTLCRFPSASMVKLGSMQVQQGSPEEAYLNTTRMGDRGSSPRRAPSPAGCRRWSMKLQHLQTPDPRSLQRKRNLAAAVTKQLQLLERARQRLEAFEHDLQHANGQDEEDVHLRLHMLEQQQQQEPDVLAGAPASNHSSSPSHGRGSERVLEQPRWHSPQAHESKPQTLALPRHDDSHLLEPDMAVRVSQGWRPSQGQGQGQGLPRHGSMPQSILRKEHSTAIGRSHSVHFPDAGPEPEEAPSEAEARAQALLPHGPTAEERRQMINAFYKQKAAQASAGGQPQARSPLGQDPRSSGSAVPAASRPQPAGYAIGHQSQHAVHSPVQHVAHLGQPTGRQSPADPPGSSLESQRSLREVYAAKQLQPHEVDAAMPSKPLPATPAKRPYTHRATASAVEELIAAHHPRLEALGSPGPAALAAELWPDGTHTDLDARLQQQLDHMIREVERARSQVHGLKQQLSADPVDGLGLSAADLLAADRWLPSEGAQLIEDDSYATSAEDF